jgi:hypothetical protein
MNEGSQVVFVNIKHFCASKDIEVQRFIRELKRLNFHPRKVGGEFFLQSAILESAFVAIGELKEQIRVKNAQRAKQQAQERKKIYKMGLAVAFKNRHNKALAEAKALLDQSSDASIAPQVSEGTDPLDDTASNERTKNPRKTRTSKD